MLAESIHLIFCLDCKRRGCSAANNRWGLVDEFVVRKCLDHKEGKVYPARDVAGEDRVAYKPHRVRLFSNGLALTPDSKYWNRIKLNRYWQALLMFMKDWRPLSNVKLGRLKGS